MTQQLLGNIGEIASLTTSQDKPPKPQPGRVIIKVQWSLRSAIFAKVRAESIIKDRSEESCQWYLVGKDSI